ncbi:hypothetical protein PCL_02871 [Purpureocillium lilacinum]|uniref:Uncharacterized protein n=1 Tax=Purpureocillium lilacinum TaxID=33203 RepID=A0A2U3DZ50_PURLI|nr:hypothetical protein Purlil1_6892 [Purpureocillium lilacinum]PWI67517.1 hypothetical protein PCL_02871 [Purpureocillium lilacinum]
MGRLDGDHVARPPSNCPPPKTANCPHWAAGAAACEEWAAAGAVKIYEQLSRSSTLAGGKASSPSVASPPTDAPPPLGSKHLVLTVDGGFLPHHTAQHSTVQYQGRPPTSMSTPVASAHHHHHPPPESPIITRQQAPLFPGTGASKSHRPDAQPSNLKSAAGLVAPQQTGSSVPWGRAMHWLRGQQGSVPLLKAVASPVRRELVEPRAVVNPLTPQCCYRRAGNAPVCIFDAATDSWVVKVGRCPSPASQANEAINSPALPTSQASIGALSRQGASNK